MIAPSRPARRRPRVVHVVQNLNYGGMERLIAEMALGADALGYESHVLALQYLGRFSRELEGRVALHLSDPLPRWSIAWPAALARKLRSLDPDVVHTHTGVWLKAAHAARLAGVPLVVHTEHGQRRPDSRHDRWLERIAARRTDVVVSVSEALAERMAAASIAAPPRLRVVANGVDLRRFDAPSRPGPRLRERLSLDPATPLLGSVGRLEHIKGFDVMVEAFARLYASRRGADAPVLVLVGDGAERSGLEAAARRGGIADRVRFLGWRDDVSELLPQLSLFTMSSRSEGTSVSLLEAMAAGRCPVVTDVGGNPAVLGPELRHRLVPSEDPEALAAAWRRALADPAAVAADGRSARARVEACWSMEAMLRRYAEIYSLADPSCCARATPIAPIPHPR